MSASIRNISTPAGTARALNPEQTRAATALAQGSTVTAAADAIGVHRSTLYKWYKDDPRFRQAVDEIRKERYERLEDQMRDVESLALSRVRRLLEDDAVPAAVQLRTAMIVLNRPLQSLGTEQWHVPLMEDLEATLEYRPSLVKVPECDIVQHISTVSGDRPRPSFDTIRHNSTHLDTFDNVEPADS